MMGIIPPNRRRRSPMLLGVFAGLLLMIFTLKPHYVKQGSSYVKGATSKLIQDLTDSSSAHDFITGNLDPDNAHLHSGSGSPPKPYSAAQAAKDAAFEDKEAPEKLDGWMFHEDPEVHEIEILSVEEGYYVIESVSTEDGKYFALDFNGRHVINPSLIPHPVREDRWIMVGSGDQQWGISSGMKLEVACLAEFVDGKMVCENYPTTLPIAATASHNCDVPDDKLAGMVGLSVGPHDARVFFGPDGPFITFGSLSHHHNVCLGQWIQDFRPLVEWGMFVDINSLYGVAKDIQRPPPMRPIEKNYFIFWDNHGRTYSHYDLEPRRVFAQIDSEGRAGKNLALLTQSSDAACWARWESGAMFSNATHQATNSLKVTLCKQSDPDCHATDTNTFIMHIFQNKLLYDGKQYYHPYVMLMQSVPPFALHAITAKPFWIKGQREPGEEIREEGGWGAKQEAPEMVYVTSMNWKEKDRNYHGYLDDVIFITFGREDEYASGVDVRLEDLIGPLVVC